MVRGERSEFYALYATAYYFMSMYWVYILENLNDRSWYIGYTANLERRIKEHQEGSGARYRKI